MLSEAHCMSFSCTELLLFNYAKVKTVFYSMAPLIWLAPSQCGSSKALVNVKMFELASQSVEGIYGLLLRDFTCLRKCLKIYKNPFSILLYNIVNLKTFAFECCAFIL